MAVAPHGVVARCTPPTEVDKRAGEVPGRIRSIFAAAGLQQRETRVSMQALNPTLAELGWRPFFSEQVSAEEARECRPARVMAVHRGMVDVLSEAFEGSISSIVPESEGPED